MNSQLTAECVCVRVCVFKKATPFSWVFLCVFILFREHDSFSCNLQIYGLYFQPWLISAQQTTLMQSVVLMTYKLFPEYDLKTRFIPGASFHCLPIVPQEVMPQAGNGAAKGKRAANSFSMKWRAAGRKSTGLLLELVCFFCSYQKWFWRKKIWRGTLSH